jgi:hypothetical protein
VIGLFDSFLPTNDFRDLTEGVIAFARLRDLKHEGYRLWLERGGPACRLEPYFASAILPLGRCL